VGEDEEEEESDEEKDRGKRWLYFDRRGPVDGPAWAVLVLFLFFLLLGLGRYWDDYRVGESQAAHTLYKRNREHVAFLSTSRIRLDNIIVRDGVFAPVQWTPSTRPYIGLRLDILENLKGCHLAERMGKPCRTAQVTYAASSLAGAILYYGPGNEAGGSGACWQAPHRMYRQVSGNTTITASGGRLAVSSDVFRDRYRKGSADFVLSDTFCRTFTGISTATNYWDDIFGDLLGCSARSRKGLGFVPVFCRVDSTNAVSAAVDPLITLLDVCVGVEDLIDTYNGTTVATRCVEEESLNACGGVEPQKPEITYVLEIPATYMRYRVYRAKDGAGGVPASENSTAHITIVQWFPPDGLAGTWLLVSDCVVMQPLCDDTEGGCPYPRFSDYIRRTNSTQCVNAYFVEQTFFYVEPAYAEAASVVVKWGGLTLVRFAGNPPAAACSSLADQESAGMFLVVGDVLALQRPVETFAMLYDVQDAVSTGVERVTLGGMCVGVKLADGASTVNILAGVNVAPQPTLTAHTGAVIASCGMLSLPTAISTRYAFRRWVYGDGGHVEKNLESEYCTDTASRRTRPVDCHCCKTRLVQGSNSVDLGVTLCSACSGTVLLVAGSGECLCQITSQSPRLSVWSFETMVMDGVELPYHGTCVRKNVTIDSFATSVLRVYSTYYACVTQNNNCALGYTLRSLDSTQVDVKVSPRLGCFIDPPSPWADDRVHKCPSHASAYSGSVGKQWRAHCKGSCISSPLHCYATITSGFGIDGDDSYKWGGVADWTRVHELADVPMGNVKINHYVCARTANRASATWQLASAFVSNGCAECWEVFYQNSGDSPIRSGDKDFVFQNCYHSDNLPRIPPNFA
jgi:hypothetical protein